MNRQNEKTDLFLPFFESISAGFPSPAADYIDKKLDLNELCIKRPESTFFIRVQGESMKGAGIFDGDILIVDRSLNPKHRDVVVAVVDGEFLVKRFCRQDKRILLIADNCDYLPIIIEEHTEFSVWGIVTRVIHSIPI